MIASKKQKGFVVGGGPQTLKSFIIGHSCMHYIKSAMVLFGPNRSCLWDRGGSTWDHPQQSTFLPKTYPMCWPVSSPAGGQKMPHIRRRLAPAGQTCRMFGGDWRLPAKHAVDVPMVHDSVGHKKKSKQIEIRTVVNANFTERQMQCRRIRSLPTSKVSSIPQDWWKRINIILFRQISVEQIVIVFNISSSLRSQ